MYRVRNRRGQAATEYILMLTISLAMTTLVFKTFLKPTLEKLRTYTVSRLNSALFGADLHRISLGR
jgi:hypothetical protein